jgi:hypothetical protein
MMSGNLSRVDELVWLALEPIRVTTANTALSTLSGLCNVIEPWLEAEGANVKYSGRLSGQTLPGRVEAVTIAANSTHNIYELIGKTREKKKYTFYR